MSLGISFSNKISVVLFEVGPMRRKNTLQSVW